MHAVHMQWSALNIVVAVIIAVVAGWVTQLSFNRWSDKPHFGTSVVVSLVVLVTTAIVIDAQKSPTNEAGSSKAEPAAPRTSADAVPGGQIISPDPTPTTAKSDSPSTGPSFKPQKGETDPTLAGTPPDSLPVGTFQVGKTALYTHGGNYSAYVSKLWVTTELLTIAIEAKGREDLLNPQKSCLIGSDGAVYPVFDWRPRITTKSHYAGTLQFVNSGLAVPVSFSYACEPGYQLIQLAPAQ